MPLNLGLVCNVFGRLTPHVVHPNGLCSSNVTMSLDIGTYFG